MLYVVLSCKGHHFIESYINEVEEYTQYQELYAELIQDWARHVTRSQRVFEDTGARVMLIPDDTAISVIYSWYDGNSQHAHRALLRNLVEADKYVARVKQRALETGVSIVRDDFSYFKICDGRETFLFSTDPAHEVLNSIAGHGF